MKGRATQGKGGAARPTFTPSSFALIFIACTHPQHAHIPSSFACSMSGGHGRVLSDLARGSALQQRTVTACSMLQQVNL